jgi:hypothetical protein
MNQFLFYNGENRHCRLSFAILFLMLIVDPIVQGKIRAEQFYRSD